MKKAPPALEPELDWIDLSQTLNRFRVSTYVSGEPEGNRLRVRYFRRASDKALVGKVWFGPGCQGPPGHAHGGSQTAVMDEALGAAAWLAGHPCFTVRLTHHFRSMIPLETVAHFEAWVEKVEDRKVFSRGRLMSQSGDVFSETDGLFLRPNDEQLAAMSKRLGSQQVSQVRD